MFLKILTPLYKVEWVDLSYNWMIFYVRVPSSSETIYMTIGQYSKFMTRCPRSQYMTIGWYSTFTRFRHPRNYYNYYMSKHCCLLNIIICFGKCDVNRKISYISVLWDSFYLHRNLKRKLNFFACFIFSLGYLFLLWIWFGICWKKLKFLWSTNYKKILLPANSR